MIEVILTICGSITAVAGVAILGRKLYLWLRPASASISYKLVMDDSGPDSISVIITNRSNSAIYLKSCKVRSTYSVFELFKKHLKRPFLSPRLYPNLRYNGCVYQFIKNEPIKVDPSELKELKIEIHEHPLNAIYGPMLLAKVTLTTGQRIYSKRVQAPKVWRIIGERG
ncbi:hypothetical protein [Marinobacterium sedimentorum]|uniref:hypothetical protein n=1 Tax=Marinobacterium sedimentorum TaxID=2927804 RepID=UPI0020C6F6B0|nr:hypothetical protein [Marinobacterium sedimentorum]MCP8690037.1 hypothetical protein [Marinobacterium sedimentorum]